MASGEFMKGVRSFGRDLSLPPFQTGSEFRGFPPGEIRKISTEQSPGQKPVIKGRIFPLPRLPGIFTRRGR